MPTVSRRHYAARPLAFTLLTALATTPALAQSKRPMTNDDIMRMRAVGGVALSPSGDRVLYTVSAWEHPNANPARGDTALGDKHDRRSHMWVVPFAGGAARQLTFSERGESGPQWSPNGTTISFVSARGAATGEEGPRPQIWLLPADGGEASQLTNARDGVSAYTWSPDGIRIAYLTPDTLSRDAEAKLRRRDDPKVYEGDFRLSHLWVIDVARKQATKVTSGDYTVRGAPSWSPDGTRLAFERHPRTLIRDERRDAYVVTIATKQLDAITTTTKWRARRSSRPTGSSLAFTVNMHEWKAYKDGIMPRTIRNAHLVTFDLASTRAHQSRRSRRSTSAPASRDGRPTAGTSGSSPAIASGKASTTTRSRRSATRKMTSDVVVGGVSPARTARRWRSCSTRRAGLPRCTCRTRRCRRPSASPTPIHGWRTSHWVSRK